MAINGYASDLEVSCKKIQNYIFNFNDLLGQGNFSKVYKARNEVTSMNFNIYMKSLPLRSCN
jgi:hypothetical protein